MQHNLAEDANVRNNQSHFGLGAQNAFENHKAWAALSRSLIAAGKATHYIQDQHALGHIFPGTDVFVGKWLAPVRGFIHQTVGGEVNFFRVAPGGLRIPTSFDATTDFLLEMRPRIPAGSVV